MTSTDYTDVRWQRMRLQAMNRDLWACVACRRSTEVTLNVHHKVYRGSQPWHARMEDLQTLCEQCHEELGPHPNGGVWYERDADGHVHIVGKPHPDRHVPTGDVGLFGNEYGQFDMDPEHILMSIERTRGKGTEDDARVLSDVVLKRMGKASSRSTKRKDTEDTN
jgi:hypothetical protein